MTGNWNTWAMLRSRVSRSVTSRPPNLTRPSLGAMRPEMTLRRVVLPQPEGPRSEEHTSELQSLMRNSYADFCLKNKRPENDNIVIIQQRKNIKTIMSHQHIHNNIRT